MTSWRYYSHVVVVSTQRAGDNDILTLLQSRVGCVYSESGKQWHPDVTTVTCWLCPLRRQWHPDVTTVTWWLCPLRERKTMTSWRYYSHVLVVSTQRAGDNDILTLLQLRVGCVHSESGRQWHPDVTTVTCWLCPLRERKTMTSWRYYSHVLVVSTQRAEDNDILTLLQSRVGCVHSESGRQWHPDVTTVTCWLCPLRERKTMTSWRYYSHVLAVSNQRAGNNDILTLLQSRVGCVHSESWIQWHPDVTTVTCWLCPLRERETMPSWRYYSHVLAVSTQRAGYNDILTLLQSRVGCVHSGDNDILTLLQSRVGCVNSESGRQWHPDVTTDTCWLCPLSERETMTSWRYYSHVLVVSTQRAVDNDILTLLQSRVGCVHSESGRQWHPDVTTVTCWLCPLRELDTMTSWRYYSHVLVVSTQRAGDNDILTLLQSHVGCVHSESGTQYHPDVTTVTCWLCPLRERDTMTSWRYYSHVLVVSTQRAGHNTILTLPQSRVGCVHSESGKQWHPDVTTVTCWLCPLRERETMTSWRYYSHKSPTFITGWVFVLYIFRLQSLTYLFRLQTMDKRWVYKTENV